MFQKTIKKEISFTGVGLHSGNVVNVKLKPFNNGIVFYRKDIKEEFILNPHNIINIDRNTALGNKGNHFILTIEHFLSAIYAYNITNLYIELDGPEIPILDGSAAPFVLILEQAGMQEIDKPYIFYKLKKTITVFEDEKYVKLIPENDIIFDLTIDFPDSIIGKEHFHFVFNKRDFKYDIAKARTFVDIKDVKMLKEKGLIKGGSIENAIVFDNKKIYNDNGLRIEKEFVKHKILDAIGDLKTINYPIIGYYKGYKSSHKLNNLLLRKAIEEEALEKIVIDNEKTLIYNKSYINTINYNFGVQSITS